MCGFPAWRAGSVRARVVRACSKSFVEWKFQNSEWEIAKIEEEYQGLLTKFSRFHARILEFTPTNLDFLPFRKDFEQALRGKSDVLIRRGGRKFSTTNPLRG